MAKRRREIPGQDDMFVELARRDADVAVKAWLGGLFAKKEAAAAKEEGLPTVPVPCLIKARPRKPKVEKAASPPMPEPEVAENGANTRRWHHARDWTNDFNWRLLLATQEFTTPEHIAFAIRLNLMEPTGIYATDKSKLSVENARAVMAAMGWPEPADRSDALLRGDGIVTGGWNWKVGSNAFVSNCTQVGAWATIHAIEDGWVEWTGKEIVVTAKWVEAHPVPAGRRRKLKEPA